MDDRKETNQHGAQPYSSDNDEINLAELCLVLWKRKVFILLATCLPTLGMVVLLWFLPTTYTATSIYDISNLGLSEKQYQLLLNRFYSNENLTQLVDQLQKNGFKTYAEALAKSHSPDDLIMLDVAPPFLDISKSKNIDAEQLIKIRDITASLLKVTINGNPVQVLNNISTLIQHNLQGTILLFTAQEQLACSIREYNQILENIEKDRWGLELELKTTNEVLANLKKVTPDSLETIRESVVLQFDVGEQNQYLPLSYQIQASESKRIGLEETIRANNEKYGYYSDLAGLSRRIVVELNAKLSSGYTIEQFKAFLVSLSDSTEKPQLKDYLKSYIRTVENKIADSSPVMGKPKIVSVSKNAAKKIGGIFAACLMLSMLSAFMMGAFKQNKVSVL